MTTAKVKLSVEVTNADGYRQVTTWTVEPTPVDLDRIKSQLRLCASDLAGQGRLDLDDEGKA